VESLKVETEKQRVVGVCRFCDKNVYAHKFRIYEQQYCHIKCFDENIVGKIRTTKSKKQRIK